MAQKKMSIGGSALMEGIMMIGPAGIGMALRLPDGSIESQLKEHHMLRETHKIAQIPFIRGPINFVDQMIFTYKILMESAEKTAMVDDEGNPEDMSKLDRWLTDHFGPKMMAVIGIVSAIIGFALAFLLFVYLPSWVADQFGKLFQTNITNWKPFIEGVLRAVILVVYMWAVSNMKDIRRMFMYHGAEHKSIACYEKGLPLTVENIRKQTRFHPRCGTSFIFLVILISVLVSSLVAILFPPLRATRALWMAVKILMLPVLLGLGYEVLQYAGKHDNLFVTISSAPGLWMQRITTKEPTDDIIEVAIQATEICLGNAEPSVNPNGEPLNPGVGPEDTAEFTDTTEPKEEENV